MRWVFSQVKGQRLWKCPRPCHMEDVVSFQLCRGPDIILMSIRIRQRSCVRPSANVWAARTSRRVLRGRRWCTWPTLQRCGSSSKLQPKPSCPHRSQICSPEPHQPSPVEVESKSFLFICQLFITTVPFGVSFNLPSHLYIPQPPSNGQWTTRTTKQLPNSNPGHFKNHLATSLQCFSQTMFPSSFVTNGVQWNLWP